MNRPFNSHSYDRYILICRFDKMSNQAFHTVVLNNRDPFQRTFGMKKKLIWQYHPTSDDRSPIQPLRRARLPRFHRLILSWHHIRRIDKPSTISQNRGSSVVSVLQSLAEENLNNLSRPISTATRTPGRFSAAAQQHLPDGKGSMNSGRKTS